MKNYRIHIGAHKTATTHFQDILEMRQPFLKAAGVDFIPRSKLREIELAKTLDSNLNFKFLDNFLANKKWKSKTDSIISTSNNILISEENFMGYTHEIFDYPIYPRLENRLLKLSKIMESDKFSLYLSIRDYASLLPSAYSQCLLGSHRIKNFNSIRERFLRNPPNWADLIHRIQTVLPNIRLKVWTFENYIFNSSPIVSELCGLEIRSDIPILPSKKTMRLSASAVKKLEHLNKNFFLRREKKMVVRNLLESNDNSEKFNPLSVEESQFLSHFYERDLNVIRKSFSETLIQAE